MKRRWKRGTAGVLIAIMSAGMLPSYIHPLPVLAAEQTNATIIKTYPAGEAITATLYEDGRLVLEGSGKMTDYDDFGPAWTYEWDKIKEVVLDERITSIGDYAFKHCSRLTTITMGDNVTTIGKNAFGGCTSLLSITLPETVTSIGEEAFYNCDLLQEIQIPSSCESIGAYAFAGCEKLTQMVLPEGITVLSKGLFLSCWGLQSVTMLGEVTAIEDSAFRSCDKLEQLTLPQSVETIGAEAFSGCTSLTTLELPSGITKLSDSVFNGCKNLVAITIPENVTEIGDSAFAGCSSLTELILPKSVAKIGDYAFSGCRGIQNIELPPQITVLSEGVFSSCSGLIEIDLSRITEIKKGAFQHCTGFTTFTFPDAVTYIAKDVLWGCSNIETISYGPNITSVGSAAFWDCTSLKSFTLPEAIEEVSAYSFMECTSLREIVIPSSVTVIGQQAFEGCTSLEKVNVPEGVTTLGKKAFYYCDGLQEITLPGTLTTIEDNAIGYCGQLKTLTIPDSVSTIGDGAFARCKNLSEIQLPAGLTKISASMVSQCESLSSITIPTTVTEIGRSVFSVCTSLESITIPKGVSVVARGLFAGCTNLKEVQLPDSIRTIEDQAFTGCKSLEEVVLPDGVQSIGNLAFDSSGYLKKIEIPSSVTKIDYSGLPKSAFILCSSDSYAKEYAVKRYNEYGYFSFIGKLCGEQASYSYDQDTFTITVQGQPEEGAVIDGGSSVKRLVFEKTTSIPMEFFCKYKALQEIVIPKSVTSIDELAFISSKSAKIICYKNSAADAFATENGYEVEYLTQEMDALSCTVPERVQYTGEALTPSVTVLDGTAVLAEGSDYTVTYRNNVNAGTATVEIKGCGTYEGTYVKTFQITKADISQAKVSAVSVKNYTGKAITPAVTVTMGNKALQKNKDYQVTYSHNKKIGTATITITGCENYSGKKSTTCAIRPLKNSKYTSGTMEYKVTKDAVNGKGEVMVTSYKGKATAVTIPDKISIGGVSYKVTAIGDSFLRANAKVKQVTIGKQVTTIGSYAFYNCKKLKTVTIQSKAIKSMGKKAWKGIEAKAKINVPNAKITVYKKLLQNSGLNKKIKVY